VVVGGFVEPVLIIGVMISKSNRYTGGPFVKSISFLPCRDTFALLTESFQAI
jgi:hypothetical protein